ncbi:MAG TPA: type II toxin-antitoxin system PemK/MazF family toxin [Candidatus Paceibacterota bacterium]
MSAVRAIHKGDVLIVDLTVSAGREQGGVRPAIAVSGGELPSVVIIIPLTSTIEALRFPNTLAILPEKDNGLENQSVALMFHMRSIDKRRIVNIIGKVDAATRKKIDVVLKKMLQLS